MFSFKDYVWEIWKVAEGNKVDVGVAYDMFRADVANGVVLPENCGKAVPEVDFVALGKQWAAMTKEEQSEARVQYQELIGRHYDALCEAYPSKTAMLAIVKGE